MSKVVITGCSRGIGLALTVQYLDAGHEVFGFCRRPENSKELIGLYKRHSSRLHLGTIDLEKPDSSTIFKKALSDWDHVDILINNAGILTQGHSFNDFERSFRINTISPYMLIQAILDKLQKSSFPKAVQVSSVMGSISQNTSGGEYPYRCSKAALNMIVKGLSIDCPWLMAISIHPGWVKTRMGGDLAPLSPTEAAQRIMQVINGATIQDSGHFFDNSGNALPW